MKFIFRGLIIFEYRPGAEVNKVIQFNIEGTSIPNFSLCIMESKHYAALSDFFKIVHEHIEGKDVDLSDIKVMPPFAAILLTAAACLFIAMAFFPDEE
jgi:hypothetical protein